MGNITFVVESNALNRATSNDSTSGLVISGNNLPAGITSGDIFVFGNINDAISEGITEAFDEGNEQIYYQISEFYRFNPSATLHVMLLEGVTVNEICRNEDYLKKLIVSAAGEIKQCGVVAALGELEYTQGVIGAVVEAIPELKSLQTEQALYMRPFVCILDGQSLTGTIAALGNLRTNSAPGISVCVAHNKGANGRTSAVGTALGLLSARKVSENIGWVAKGNVTDLAKDRFVSAELVGTGNSIINYEENYQDLHNKGFLFVRPYANYSGFYFFDDANLAQLSDDVNSLSLQRVINKAQRLLYAKLLPRVNSPVLVNPTTGRIAAEVAKSYEADGLAALNVMLQNEEVSGVAVYVNENQDVVTNGNIEIQYEIVPIGTARNITNKISLAVKLSS